MKRKKPPASGPPFTTTHHLLFEISGWEKGRLVDALFGPDKNPFIRFRVGTCQGLWRSTEDSYDILAIDNEQPGNGHLTDVFEWFEHSCRRDGKVLRVLELRNKNFERHLVQKRGFTAYEKYCEKTII